MNCVVVASWKIFNTLIVGTKFDRPRLIVYSTNKMFYVVLAGLTTYSECYLLASWLLVVQYTIFCWIQTHISIVLSRVFHDFGLNFSFSTPNNMGWSNNHQLYNQPSWMVLIIIYYEIHHAARVGSIFFVRGYYRGKILQHRLKLLQLVLYIYYKNYENLWEPIKMH